MENVGWMLGGWVDGCGGGGQRLASAVASGKKMKGVRQEGVKRLESCRAKVPCLRKGF